jgi:site-specific recombinase XerD
VGWLREREDLAPASIRNYLSGLRHFIAWFESEREAHVHDRFTPQGITTPTLTRYRTYLQIARRQKPASVNRSLISLKRSFGWTFQQRLITYDPYDLRHRFSYRMAESVRLHRLAQIMGYDSLDTTRLYIQGTQHDLQQAVETIAWT